MQIQQLIDLFAGVALITNDVLPIASALGALIIFATGLYCFITKKHVWFSTQAIGIATFGMLFGTGLQICWYLSPTTNKLTTEGVFIKLPPTIATSLIILTFALYFLGRLLRRASSTQPQGSKPPTRRTRQTEQ
jgi:hypothetical protein